MRRRWWMNKQFRSSEWFARGWKITNGMIPMFLLLSFLR
jgi:hypothetical protein